MLQGLNISLVLGFIKSHQGSLTICSKFSHLNTLPLPQVHERSEELDFLLLIVRKLLRSNSRYVKVIVK